MTSRGVIVLLLALFIGVAGFFLVRWQQHMLHHHGGPESYAQHGADGHHAELDWLQIELGVTDAQLAKIKELHLAYHPVCETLTHRLEQSHAKLESLTQQATTVNPELNDALSEHAEIHLECQRAMLKHFYDTAGCISAPQAQRYLQRMLPLVFRHDEIPAGDSKPHVH